MRFDYYNDTKRTVTIHPATKSHGCTVDMSAIEHGTIRTFLLPEGTYPWVKMWDYGSSLSILVSPTKIDKEDE